jgi:hypothetical protein
VRLKLDGSRLSGVCGRYELFDGLTVEYDKAAFHGEWKYCSNENYRVCSARSAIPILELFDLMGGCGVPMAGGGGGGGIGGPMGPMGPVGADLGGTRGWWGQSGGA